MSEVSTDTQGDNSIWIRGLYMLLFLLFYSVAEFVMMVVIIVQFGYRLFSDECQPRLLQLGGSVALYIYQVLQFLSFNSDEMPYPFKEWPVPDSGEEEQ